MSKKRRSFSAEFKAKVGLEALKGIEPVHVIAQRHEVHPVQVGQWKKEVAARLPEVFTKPSAQVKDEIERDRREKDLYAQIGQLQMELEWLKKKLARSGTEERRGMIEPEHPKLSVVRQCELLELPRSTYYHRPESETEENLDLMKVIDEVYLAYPFFGSRQMTRWLQRQGHRVNRKRVRRLMAAMGLEAIYRRPNLSKASKAHPIYPYLLRGLAVTRPNQAWATDITYIPVRGGYVYLCAPRQKGSGRVLSILARSFSNGLPKLAVSQSSQIIFQPKSQPKPKRNTSIYLHVALLRVACAGVEFLISLFTPA